MKITNVHLRNFRRLENVEIGFEAEETVFVGPNNSGKTSATAAFRLFLVRQEFKIHDFSVSRIAEINAFGTTDSIDKDSLPSIKMDIWFSINPDIEFGRVFSLVPNVSASLEKVGVRMKFSVKDAKKLKYEYLATFPRLESGVAQKTLSHYLSLQGNLNRHFGLSYYALENTENDLVTIPLEPEEGKRVLKSLVRVDFVDAQRNIDDQENGRSNRLSSAFAAFYKKNLEQAEINEDANRIIDENNESLTKHYDKHFKDLMVVIKSLGVPSANDRELKIISSLSSESALQGNTALLYVDPVHNHELPEVYNGLGFKNLVYMAIQISHFHLQWINTEEKRPLCQIIFVEEPEVHLHAQVQQTFVSNIWEIIRKASDDAGESHMVPQIGITTHSSHILDAVEFRKVRYFRRCALDGEDQSKITTLNASKVLSLRDFKPQKKSAAGEIENEEETLDFLKRYLKLTHCDLFFADAAVLVEGTVEKLLLPKMMEKSAPGLKQNYLTVLEVGGAYASRFASLLEFLGIAYLVITDLDSVDPTNKRKVCRADTPGSVTSNASLKFYFNKSVISDLVKLNHAEQILPGGRSFVAFQKPTTVIGHNPAKEMHGRTFEETFIYQNLQLFRDRKIGFEADIPGDQDFEKEYSAIFEGIKSPSFKKTEFALGVASVKVDWETPQYIAEGLSWLEKTMCANPLCEANK
ncbi:MAG: AAA family ATPase [Candidatus Moranbacteria bacterium]|nr:AAA family ATPase [Candidatus Moranbacteria bacterium]